MDSNATPCYSMMWPVARGTRGLGLGSRKFGTQFNPWPMHGPSMGTPSLKFGVLVVQWWRWRFQIPTEFWQLLGPSHQGPGGKFPEFLEFQMPPRPTTATRGRFLLKI